MRKKIWVAIGDIILVGLRDFDDSNADVIHKYKAEEARNLKSYGELPSALWEKVGTTRDTDAVSGRAEDCD